MMKLSTKCRYGLRALVDLARFGRNSPVALHQIASRQDLSLKYLEQEFAVLRKAGVVRSVKGAQGGYHLTRVPEDYAVSELVRILEGDLNMVKLDRNVPMTPLRHCIDDVVWHPLNETIEAYLAGISLADLVRDYEEEQEPAQMYYI